MIERLLCEVCGKTCCMCPTAALEWLAVKKNWRWLVPVA